MTVHPRLDYFLTCLKLFALLASLLRPSGPMPTCVKPGVFLACRACKPCGLGSSSTLSPMHLLLIGLCPTSRADALQAKDKYVSYVCV